jgi:hypothetical protein
MTPNEENDMDRASSMHEIKGEFVQHFSSKVWGK